MTRFLRYSGFAASLILIAFGVGSLIVGINGRSEVRSDLKREQIVGTPDMKGVANQKILTGSQAKQFAAGMRVHTMEATGGQTYAQMGRYLDKAGKPTSDEKAAAVDPKSGKPVENPLRNLWVTETALTTALNTSYFAENVATFAMVMGGALILVGIGFSILALKVLQEPETKTERAPAPKGTLATSV